MPLILTLSARISFAALLACVLSHPAYARSDPQTAQCGGAIEKNTWALWDSFGRDFINNAILDARLIKQGDTDALYDTQTYLQNLAEMAVRCGRTSRLEQIAGIIGTAYRQLEQISRPGGGVGWVCRGGRICTSRNRLIGTEVKLYSVQFLALAAQVANALAHDPNRTSDDSRFVRQTLDVAISHLDRWTRGSDPLKISERLAATPASVRNGESKLFFTDNDLWMLTLEAEIAGILDVVSPAPDSFTSSVRDQTGAAFRGLTRLLVARLSIRTIQSARFGTVTVADLDRGFWRQYADSRFAAYTDPAGPVTCSPDGKRIQKPGFKPADVPLVDDIGWDFSHARRFVHAFASLDSNRLALMHVWQIQDEDLPPANLSSEFAATLVTTLWNGDVTWPLFSNYWNGSNGWYRVAYDNGSTGCFAGYGPSGLSDAFTTGDFIVWQQYQPIIGTLGLRLLDLSTSTGSDEQAFIRKYYSGLSTSASEANRKATQLMFWPSLVAGATE